MAEPSKDTIYVDIDEEITGLIDKVRSSSSKVVALVLPKRASLLQSIVNMKLLKRAADESKKHLVLITAESGLLPLAGAVGVHVAKTLQSKPEIPSPPAVDDGREEEVDEEAAELDDEPDTAARATPVGALAAAGAAADDLETIELDNSDEAAAAAEAAQPKTFTPPKKKNPKLHVPNFERFRVLLVVGVLALTLLIIGLILALTKLPKATISIQTNASNVNATASFDLSTTATSLDASSNTVPAKQVSEQKTYTGTATATGQQNNGNKAAGSITMSAEECGTPTAPADVPAGTGLSSGGKTYITQSDTSFTYNKIKGGCIFFNASSSTNVTAQSAGASYNTNSNNETFAVAGRSDVSASGGASGGSDNIQTVVQQSDIDNAKAKVSAQGNAVKSDLQNQLKGDNLYAIATTFTAGTPTTTTSANVGDPASNVTVTETITYTEYGARQNDLKTLIDSNIKSQVDTSHQGILDDGLKNASFVTNGSNPLSLTVTSTAEVGPNIDTGSIKQQAVGKKSGDIQTAVKNDSNVTGVTVKFSPFWVTTAPKNTARITVNVAKPSASSSN